MTANEINEGDPIYECVQYNYVTTNVEQEINEAVARKLGVKGNPWHDVPGGVVLGQNQYPDYCTSIEAAWEIVEHLQAKPDGHIINLSWDTAMKRARGEIFNMTDNPYHPSVEYADTAPMSICLAFLKLP